MSPVGDVSKVTDMDAMFYGAEGFNADISTWDVSKVTDMTTMFYGAKSFNSDISRWDVSQVFSMIGTFEGAIAFNSDLSKWDVSSVIDMSSMFTNAKMFKRDLSKWDISNVQNILRIRGAVGGNEEKGGNGRLKWEGRNEIGKNTRGIPGIKVIEEKKKDLRPKHGRPTVSFIPGPAGGVLCAGSIIPRYDFRGNRIGSAKCQTVIDDSTPLLGFSKDTKALRLEVTGDGQPYTVVVREKDKSFWGTPAPVWQAEVPTKAGKRTVVELPLDKETWHKTVKGKRVNGGELPEWSKLQGIGVMIDSADMHGNEDRYQKYCLYQIIIHSMEIKN